MNGRSIRFLRSLIPCLLFLAVISKPFSSDAAPSSRPGYGSIPYSGGVTFRVWAPNASSVTVALSPGFSTTANPLFSEGTNGVWSVDVSGAAAGQQYKYYLNGSLWKQDPRCRKEVSSTGNSIVYNTTNFNWAGDTFTSVPLNDAVVYELDIGSFNGTTFTSATNRLAFLKQLGISAVEVMPINEFPGNSSWGYNPSDLFGVETGYGGPDGFKAFVKTCHQLGLGVIVDVVHNHYGPSDLDLWQFDGSSSGGYGGIYFYQTAGLCCTPYGNTRPNYSTQQVRNFIQDTFSMWLDEYHVDGFRWDSPGYMMNSDAGFNTDAQTLIQQCSTMIHTGYVGKINIGEDQGWLSGTSGFDSTWANVFFDTVLPQLTNSSDSSRSMLAISSAVNLNHDGVGSGGWGNVLFMENHDKSGLLNAQYGANRLPVRISASSPTGYAARKRSTLGIALTLTAPGIPMILQGEEMLTTDLFNDSTAINWSLTNTYSGIVSLYRDLIRLRRNLDGVSSGLKGLNGTTLNRDESSTGKLIAYSRWDTGATGDDVVVVANFVNLARTNYTINFPKSGNWYTQFNSDSTNYGSDYGNIGSRLVVASGSSPTGQVTIAPYSVLILTQMPPPNPPAPVASFTGSPTNGAAPLTVTFSDTSTSVITNRFWDFGDSSTANTATNTVVHTYATGTYPVELIVAGPGGAGTNAKPNYIAVHTGSSTISVDVANLYDGFGTLMPVSGVAVLVADIGNNGFVDPQPEFPLSLGAIWGTDDRIVGIWDPSGCNCGDGSLSGQTVVTYTNGIAPGQKLQLYWFPSLTLASNTVGATYYGKYADTNSPPLDGSDAWQMPASDSSAYLIFWTTLVGGSNPESAGLATRFTAVSLSAGFTASPTNGVAPLAVAFTDTSTGTISNRFWDFGDGSTSNATATSLSHPYIAGIYTVTLVASGPAGVSTNIQSNAITVLTPFAAWQTQYFGCTNCPQAAADADPLGKGMSNTNQFLAGLNPTNSHSAFRILAVAREGGDLRVTWSTAGGHTNAVQAALNLGASYSDISSNVLITGSGDTTTNYLDLGGATNAASRFYRVRLVP